MFTRYFIPQYEEDRICDVTMDSYNVVIAIHQIGPFDTYEI